jgi:2,3-bisphosphoglycerate-independent phosphoglycerate mutase
MKAAEVTDVVVAKVRELRPRFVRVNYANGDMVAHTGDPRATRMAVEAVDLCLQRLKALVRETGGVLVVTADHGNADSMLEADGKQVRTSHSLNPVPFAVYDPREPGDGPKARPVEAPGLANVAATCLELLGYLPPPAYAPSLLGS